MSPFRPSPHPQPVVFSHSSLLASAHDPLPTLSRPLFSCSYKSLLSHARFRGPLFSCRYKSLPPQLLSFHIHTKPPGVTPPALARGRSSPPLCLSVSVANRILLAARSLSLLPLFSALPFFVFSRLQPLFPKTGEWVGSMMINRSFSGARSAIADHDAHVRGIKEFDSYEPNFGLESRCWSIIRATNRAAQPREIRPNTRVKTRL